MNRRVLLSGAMLLGATPLLGAALSLLTGAAKAEDYAVGDLKVGNPWARATPRGSNVAAAYLTITNNGGAADRLMRGSTSVASRFEVHSMVIEDGVAKMRPVEGGLEIKARETVELKPGSYHVMLMGLTQPLQEGQHVTGTLVFERAGKVDVQFTVLPIGQSPPAGGHSGHH
jgi:periplasmic copper chaperone A